MVQLFSVYFGVKGAMSQFLGLAMLPLYKQMGLDGLKYQAASTVCYFWNLMDLRLQCLRGL